MARSVEHSTILSEFVTRVLVAMVIYRMMLQYTKILQPSAFVVCFCSLETVNICSRRRGSRSDQKMFACRLKLICCLTLCEQGFFMLSLSSADFFFKINFYQIKTFRNTIRVSNVLDPDLGPDLLPRSLAYHPLRRLRTCVIKIVTFKGGHLIW